MTRLLQQRLIAALLPFSFVWAFVACVSMCERETLANHSPAAFASSNNIAEISGTTECDGCQLSYSPRATTRIESVLYLDSAVSVAAPTLSIHSADPNGFSNRIAGPFLNGSPPRKLLSSLRI